QIGPHQSTVHVEIAGCHGGEDCRGRGHRVPGPEGLSGAGCRHRGARSPAASTGPFAASSPRFQESDALGCAAVPRRNWVPLAVLAALLAMGALASWAIWRFSQPALHERILAEARKRGFELEMEDFSVDPDRVVLRNATVRPTGVRGLAARADTVTLSLSGLT